MDRGVNQYRRALCAGEQAAAAPPARADRRHQLRLAVVLLHLLWQQRPGLNKVFRQCPKRHGVLAKPTQQCFQNRQLIGVMHRVSEQHRHAVQAHDLSHALRRGQQLPVCSEEEHLRTRPAKGAGVHDTHVGHPVCSPPGACSLAPRSGWSWKQGTHRCGDGVPFLVGRGMVHSVTTAYRLASMGRTGASRMLSRVMYSQLVLPDGTAGCCRPLSVIPACSNTS